MTVQRSLENVLVELELQLLDAEHRAVPAKVAALLAREFVEIGSSGRLFSREEVIEALATETPVSREMSDFNASLLAPNIALVTYRICRAAMRQPPTSSLHSSIWRLDDGRWQMVFHQGTPTGSPATAR